MSTLLTSDMIVAINAAGKKLAAGRLDRGFNSAVAELELDSDAAGEHLLLSGFRTILNGLKRKFEEGTKVCFMLPGITASKFLTAWGARKRGVDAFAGVHVKGTKDLQVCQAWMPEAYREELKAAVEEAFDGYFEVCFADFDAISKDEETGAFSYTYKDKDGQEVTADGTYIGSIGNLIEAVKELTPAPQAVKPVIAAGIDDLF